MGMSGQDLQRVPEGRLARYPRCMAFVPAPMDDVQRSIANDVINALAIGDLDVVWPGLADADGRRVWVTPPLLSVAAGILTVLATGTAEKPWPFNDTLWDEHLPEQKPATATEWRRANFALHAAGCLAAGIWLDVGVT